jgi:hypothetical protein
MRRVSEVMYPYSRSAQRQLARFYPSSEMEPEAKSPSPFPSVRLPFTSVIAPPTYRLCWTCKCGGGCGLVVPHSAASVLYSLEGLPVDSVALSSLLLTCLSAPWLSLLLWSFSTIDGLVAVLELADSSPRLSHDGLLDLIFRFLDELPKPLVFFYANLRRSCAGLQSACVAVSLCQ